MLFYNEHLQQLNARVLLTELADLDSTIAPDKRGIERILTDYYDLATCIDAAQYGIGKPHRIAANAGQLVWQKLKDYGCPMLAPNADAVRIVEVLLPALASIIPGGIIIIPMVRKLVKYIVQNGLGTFCNYMPDALGHQDTTMPYLTAIKHRLQARI